MDDLKAKIKQKLSLLGSKGSGSASGAFSGTGHRLGSGQTQSSRPAAATRPAAPPQPAVPAPSQQRHVQQRPALSNGADSRSIAVAGPGAPLQPAVQPSAASQPPQPRSLPAGGAPEEVQAAAAQLGSDPEGAAAAGVLARLLSNIVAAPTDPKFRRLRLNNPRIAAVAHANGGIELLLACGFEIQFEGAAGAASSSNSDGDAEQAQEGFAVLPEGADLTLLQHALRLLGTLLPTPPSSAAATDGSSARSSSSSSAAVPAAAPAAAHQPARQQQRGQRPPREWEPPRERHTQVLLPTSVERDVPDWFFQRTGAELKAAFVAAVRRREQDKVLMTRAMRERLRSPAGPSPTSASIRVRFPEGISLQGEFGAGEPVAAIFAWVADCLSDPLHTYELVLPSRQTLEVQAQSVREADLLPSVALLFRWTGQSAVEMAQAPALRPELLRTAKPATVTY